MNEAACRDLEKRVLLWVCDEEETDEEGVEAGPGNESFTLSLIVWAGDPSEIGGPT